MAITQALGLFAGLTALALVVTLTWTNLLGRQLLVTAPAAFLGYQLINVFGLITRTDYNGSQFEVAWPFLALLGYASFVVGAILVSRAMRFDPGKEVPAWRNRPLENDLKSQTALVLVGAIALMAVVVGIIFARAVGYNTLDLALGQYLMSGSVDQSAISQLRSGATRDRYVAAGYAVQFTAIILPALILVIYVGAKERGLIIPKILAGVLALLDVYFTTVVGGRVYLIGAVLVAALLLLSATSPLPPRFRKRGVAGVGLVVLFLGLYAFTSLLQGRAEGGAVGIIKQSTIGFYDRTGGEYSYNQLRAIALLEDEAPVLGSHWWEELKTAIPGPNEKPTFDERLHASLFRGNLNGNQPLDPWGSYYYNWGVPGLVVVPLAAGAVLQFFTVKFLLRGGRRLISVVLLSVCSYRLMFLIGPYSVLLEGSVTLLLLYALLKAVTKPGSTAPVGELHRSA